MARAVADGRVPGFVDPTAMALLPEASRAVVERVRAGAAPRNFREGFEVRSMEARAHAMALRTLEIDAAVTSAAAIPPRAACLRAPGDRRGGVQSGRESQTAIIVCMARAVADGRVPGFVDPTAMALLPEASRAIVERVRAGAAPRNFREGFEVRAMEARAHAMALRTLEIDAAVTSAAAPQVVILGAGLDGRAWRMPELAAATVFEVDHPDSQREKRARVAALRPIAREVRFVPVDFARDELDRALAAAGHDPTRPTTWIWEGVVMYLTGAEIDATLAVVARRSTPDSRLAVVYHAPAAMLLLVGLFVRRLGEPLRSVHTPARMSALLRGHGFEVLRDVSTPELGHALGPEHARITRAMKHQRIVTARRARA